MSLTKSRLSFLLAAACATLIALAIALSMFFAVQLSTPEVQIELVKGGLSVYKLDRPLFGVEGWTIRRITHFGFHVLPIWEHGPMPNMPSLLFTFFKLPLWMPLALAASVAGFLWRRIRHTPPGHCLQCGYSLIGNMSGVCPECGTAIAPTSAGPGTS